MDRAPPVVPFTPFAESRALGGFIVIDRQRNATAAAGMIDFALTRSANIARQELSVDRQSRAAMKGQRPKVIWFTGLSGSGKSTIANAVERKLYAAGRHTYMLDGDNVRHGLNRDLGFIEGDRVENIRRVAEVAALMADAGLIVLMSFISPYRAERQMARELFPEGDLIEVFVDTPIEECRRRDPKALYAKADAGLIENFTGVDAPYEAPEQGVSGIPCVGKTRMQGVQRCLAANSLPFRMPFLINCWTGRTREQPSIRMAFSMP